MNTRLRLVFLFALIFTGHISYGQSAKEQARAKSNEAVKMEDEEGKFDEAIKLIEDAQKLDPENSAYPYEIAYAYSSKKEYKKASDILEKLTGRKDVQAVFYQALGNAYDFQGKTNKAIDTYEKGLKKFPESGNLYLELGNIQLIKKDYDKALDYYETGIEKDPKFPSNYYRAAKLYCNSDQAVWGMIYGEIFMNIERGSKRTAEISQLLYDTYKSKIKFISDTSYSVNFCNKTIILSDALKNPDKIKLPFGLVCYEKLIMLSIINEKKIDLITLDSIRNNFVDFYFQHDDPKNYPNILFEYQQKIKTAGHFDAYNYWLLRKGDEETFNRWRKENQAAWDAFNKWYIANPIELDQAHKFYRRQY